LIEDLIDSGQLKKFLERATQGKSRRTEIPKPLEHEGEEKKGKEEPRVAVNTIVGGFSGGGDTMSARIRYARRTYYEINQIGRQVSPNNTPDLSFSPEDARETLPHDDDPLVIQVHILNCDVERVLIDTGSSTDVLY
jgi:hypothetical protein